MRTMPQASPVDAATVELVLDHLRRSGARVTTARRAIVEAMVDAAGHRTADELAAAIHAVHPSINRSTVYRNLEELERLGVLVHAHLGHGAATYHLSANAHSHLVCERCGVALSVTTALFSNLSATMLEQYGFTIDPLHFSVLGICAPCRSADAP